LEKTLNLKGYFPALDGLRGLSISLVVLNHWTVELGSLFGFLRARGHLGVEVFFAISGFLVARSLHSCYLKFPESPQKVVQNFMTRRLARIFAPYFMLLVSIYLLSFFVGSLAEKTNSISDISWSFPLYFYNYAKSWTSGVVPGSLNISWSLCFEEQFYLFLAGVFLVAPKKLKTVLWVACLGSIGFRFGELLNGSDLTFFQLQMETHRRMDSILWGVLTYLYWQKISKFYRKKRFLSLALSLGPIVVFLLGVIHHGAFDNALVFTGTAIFFTLLIPEILVFDQSIFNKVLQWAPLVFVGKISYEIYLTHQLVNGLVSRGRFNDLPLVYGGLYLFGSLLISFLFYKFVSLPSQILIRKTFLQK